MRGPDVGTMLVRALVKMASDAGCALAIVKTGWVAWASATFSGAQHTIMLRSEDEGFVGWLGDLAEAEFALKGHLVADIAVDSMHREDRHYVATIAALTLVEG